MEKLSGPDKLPNLILKNAANEISPFLKIIFDQSLQTGKLPDDWVEAIMLPQSSKKRISNLPQTTGQYPSHVFVPN